MKAAPTTTVKNRGWSLTITTRGSSGDGYANGIAKPALRQLFRGALHAGGERPSKSPNAGSNLQFTTCYAGLAPDRLKSCWQD
jgi:hypothetical protein